MIEIIKFNSKNNIFFKKYISGLALKSYNVHKIKNGNFKTDRLCILFNKSNMYVNLIEKTNLLLKKKEIIEIIKYKIKRFFLFIKRIFLNKNNLIKMEINIIKKKTKKNKKKQTILKTPYFLGI